MYNHCPARATSGGMDDFFGNDQERVEQKPDVSDNSQHKKV